MKPLFIPLRTEWFDAFLSGEKTVEYRRFGAGWNQRTLVAGRKVVLSHGYTGSKGTIPATVRGFELIDNTFTDIYPRGVKLVAIHFQVHLSEHSSR